MQTDSRDSTTSRRRAQLPHPSSPEHIIRTKEIPPLLATHYPTHSRLSSSPIPSLFLPTTVAPMTILLVTQRLAVHSPIMTNMSIVSLAISEPPANTEPIPVTCAHILCILLGRCAILNTAFILARAPMGVRRCGHIARRYAPCGSLPPR